MNPMVPKVAKVCIQGEFDAVDCHGLPSLVDQDALGILLPHLRKTIVLFANE